jgi:hypothetical protein
MEEPVVMSWAEARAQGMVKYLSDQPCARGHVAWRRVKNNQCYECHRLSGRGELPPLNKPKQVHQENGGFTPDPVLWPDDGGKLRVPIYDHNYSALRPPRLVRKVGWTNCLGRGPRHRIFSYDVARERMCTACKAMQTRGTIDD